MSRRHFLFSDDGRAYLLREYSAGRRSTYDIAREQGTYANMVRRALLAHGIPLRDKREAQEAAMEAGRSEHPTLGKERSERDKERIGLGVARAWEDLPDGERERRVEDARRRWRELSEWRRRALMRDALAAVRGTASQGSRLERYLARSLRTAGLTVEAKARVPVPGDEVRVDLFLPQARTAIEVNGPFHYVPVWGAERLARTQAADARRADLLLRAGLTLVRVRNTAKSLSEVQMRRILVGVAGAIALPPGRLVELEVGA